MIHFEDRVLSMDEDKDTCSDLWLVCLSIIAICVVVVTLALMDDEMVFTNQTFTASVNDTEENGFAISINDTTVYIDMNDTATAMPSTSTTTTSSTTTTTPTPTPNVAMDGDDFGYNMSYFQQWPIYPLEDISLNGEQYLERSVTYQ